MADKPDLLLGVNRPKDFDNMTDLEKEHVPVITAPDTVKPGECFEIVVEVGKLSEHPNENAHFIQFIELYAGHTYLARQDFTAGTTCPVMKVCASFDRDLGPLRAFERCNLRGAWETDRNIAVQA